MSSLNMRYSQATWAGIVNDITLIGLGTIGRNAAEHLYLLGHNLLVYEPDTVEEHNCIPQGFNPKQIGQLKIDAFQEQVKSFKAPLKLKKISSINKHFERDDYLTPIVIAAVDNMDVRKDIYETWKSMDNRVLFLDGRMMAEQFEVIVTTKDQDNYMDTWFEQSEAPIGFCSNRATRHCGQMIGATICQMICNFNSGLILNNSYYAGQFQEYVFE